MDTEKLRYFIEVAQQGSFAAAARQLDTDPSAVTRSVSSLEKHLGVRLLERTTRQLALTEAGNAYLAHARQLMSDLQRAGDEVRDLAGHPTGIVRVTASTSYGHTIVIPMLGLLHKAYPALEIDLMLTDSVVDLVAERIDVALRLRQVVDTSLIGTRLTKIRYHVCASPAYLAQHGSPHEPADLALHQCLRCPWPGYRTLWRFRDAAGEVQEVGINGWLTLSNSLGLQRAALDGLGPALLPDWLVMPDLLAGRLVDLFPLLEATPTDFDNFVWMLHTSRSYLPKRVRAFLDFAKKHAHPTTHHS